MLSQVADVGPRALPSIGVTRTRTPQPAIALHPARKSID